MKKKPTNFDFNIEMLDILVCPVSKKSLTYDKKKGILVSKSSGLSYPIINGIPVLLKSESKKL